MLPWYGVLYSMIILSKICCPSLVIWKNNAKSNWKTVCKRTTPSALLNVFLMDHRKSKRIPWKHLFLLHWLCQKFWLCASQQTGKFFKRWEFQTTLSAPWDTCSSVVKNLPAMWETWVRSLCHWSWVFSHRQPREASHALPLFLPPPCFKKAEQTKGKQESLKKKLFSYIGS